MLELYQDTLIDLLLPKNAKRLRLEIKKDSKVSISSIYISMKNNIKMFNVINGKGYRFCNVIISYSFRSGS
jgi:hypothetical protein